MIIASIHSCICPHQLKTSPWILYADRLAESGIFIKSYDATQEEAWDSSYDSMIFQVWNDYGNSSRFKAEPIMRAAERFSRYRYEYSQVRQIICNHTDMSRHPYALPYWRVGDSVLARTPPYNRSELYPFEASRTHSYEVAYGENYGSACFSGSDVKFDAGVICSETGPVGYRKEVANETAKVGIGQCVSLGEDNYISREKYNQLMSQCRIIVCPRGWGEQSHRHWDAWQSRKPILTDSDCAAVEMIPGIDLVAGVHYLVYSTPAEIPDIVSDWSRPSKADDLSAIAENGYKAVSSFRPVDRLVSFFNAV